MLGEKSKTKVQLRNKYEGEPCFQYELDSAIGEIVRHWRKGDRFAFIRKTRDANKMHTTFPDATMFKVRIGYKSAHMLHLLTKVDRLARSIAIEGEKFDIVRRSNTGLSTMVAGGTRAKVTCAVSKKIDTDAKNSYPMYELNCGINSIVPNHKNGDRFVFLHEHTDVQPVTFEKIPPFIAAPMVEVEVNGLKAQLFHLMISSMIGKLETGTAEKNEEFKITITETENGQRLLGEKREANVQLGGKRAIAHAVQYTVRYTVRYFEYSLNSVIGEVLPYWRNGDEFIFIRIGEDARKMKAIYPDAPMFEVLVDGVPAHMFHLLTMVDRLIRAVADVGDKLVIASLMDQDQLPVGNLLLTKSEFTCTITKKIEITVHNGNTYPLYELNCGTKKKTIVPIFDSQDYNNGDELVFFKNDKHFDAQTFNTFFAPQKPNVVKVKVNGLPALLLHLKKSTKSHPNTL